MGLLSLTMSSCRPIPCTWLVTFLLISLCSVSIQDDIIDEEIEDPDAPEEIKTLQTETGLSISQAFRCGIFIVNPADDNGLPLTDLKVFPAPFVGGKRSRRFPKGLQFGLYSNSCNETMWHFTGVKHDETICCGRAKLIDCPSGI